MVDYRKGAERWADICGRLISGDSLQSISRSNAVGIPTLHKMIGVLRARGIEIAERPGATLVDAARAKKVRELVCDDTLSARQIAREAGVSLSYVRKARSKYQEALPPSEQAGNCACGLPLHHARLCEARQRDIAVRRGRPHLRLLLPEQRSDAERRLGAGEKIASIAARFRLPPAAITKLLERVDPEVKENRKAARATELARRRAAGVAKSVLSPRSTDPRADPLYQKIASLIDNRIDPALRDDMISQAYLDVLEGRTSQSDLKSGVKRARAEILKSFANPWGDLSLDAPLAPGSDRTLLDCIAETCIVEQVAL